MAGSGRNADSEDMDANNTPKPQQLPLDLPPPDRASASDDWARMALDDAIWRSVEQARMELVTAFLCWAGRK